MCIPLLVNVDNHQMGCQARISTHKKFNKIK